MMQHDKRSKDPVAQEVLAFLDKQMNRRVIDFAQLKLGAEQAKEIEKCVISEAGMKGLDPLHAVYAYAQNKISVIVDHLVELPMCAKLAQTYADAEEEYMPSSPPMSPLTMSYFFCWAVFDSCIGKARETLGTVAIDVCRRLGTEWSLLRLFELMQSSRMGFYMHEGTAGPHAVLREFVTGERHKCIVPAGYMGKRGEIWFVRVLPEPYESLPMGYSLIFNTPYVIATKKNGHYMPADSSEWQAFFDRTLPKTGIEDTWNAYAYLMKYGLSLNYWNEYVFQGYANHRHDMIMLAGFPDMPLSRPHSRESEARKEDGMPAQVGPDNGNTPVQRQKMGRNDPCPCGSGKKYKKSCGAR